MEISNVKALPYFNTSAETTMQMVLPEGIRSMSNTKW